MLKKFSFILITIFLITVVSGGFGFQDGTLPKLEKSVLVVGSRGDNGGSINPGDIEHNDLDNLLWSIAGHTIDTTFDFNNNNFINVENGTILDRLFFINSDHWIKRGAEGFGGIATNAFSFQHKNEHAAGTITFIVTANKSNSDTDAVSIMSQVGRNNSAGVLGNSWMVIPNNLTSNLTTFSDCFLVADALGETLRVQCDTGDTGADLIVHDDGQFFGTVFADEGIRAETLASFLMNGNDFQIQNGSLHIFTPVTFISGVNEGDNIFKFQESFVGGLGTFINIQVDTGNWFATTDVLCDDGDCANTVGLSGAGDIIMEANISTTNIENASLQFVYSLVNMLGANDFTVTANNNVGSGEVNLFTDSTNNVDKSSQSVALPSSMWDQSNVGIRFNCDVTQTNRECYVDTVSVNGSAIATTATEQSGFNSEICFSSGTRDAGGNCLVGVLFNASQNTIFPQGNWNFTDVSIGGVDHSATTNLEWASAGHTFTSTDQVMDIGSYNFSTTGGIQVGIGSPANDETAFFNVTQLQIVGGVGISGDPPPNTLDVRGAQGFDGEEGAQILLIGGLGGDSVGDTPGVGGKVSLVGGQGGIEGGGLGGKGGFVLLDGGIAGAGELIAEAGDVAIASQRGRAFIGTQTQIDTTSIFQVAGNSLFNGTLNVTGGGSFGYGNFTISNTGSITLDSDSSEGGKIILGEGQDAEIYYSGTHLVLDPDVVGTGQVRVLGDFNLRGATADLFLFDISEQTASINGIMFNPVAPFMIDDDLNVTGSMNVTGNITANAFIGDGSQLTGITGGNLSFNQSLTDTLYAQYEFGANNFNGTGNFFTTGNISGSYLNLTGIPIGTEGIGNATLTINPPSAMANGALLSMGVAGTLVFSVDEDGDITEMRNIASMNNIVSMNNIQSVDTIKFEGNTTVNKIEDFHSGSTDQLKFSGGDEIRFTIADASASMTLIKLATNNITFRANEEDDNLDFGAFNRPNNEYWARKGFNINTDTGFFKAGTGTGTGGDLQIGYNGAGAVYNITTTGVHTFYNSTGLGGVRADEFITGSYVPDTKNLDYLGLLDNIDDWKNPDGSINHASHYAYVQVEEPDFDNCWEEINWVEYCLLGNLSDVCYLDLKNIPKGYDYEEFTYYRTECGIKLADGLGLEIRAGNMEGMISELREENNLMKASLCNLNETQWC